MGMLFNFVKEAGEKLWDSVSGKPEDKAAKLKQHLEQVGLPGADKVDIKVEDDKVIVGGEAADQELKEKLMVVLGNVATIGKVEDHLSVAQPSEAGNFYTVKKGDTLSAIAKSQYGDANKYMQIFEANKPMLSHPDKIYPGQVLRIPKL
ncbi:peptidoglycan-binding protein LysM [Pragia fontium]|uniref:Potassium binding protein Kbp n=2 Tax=Pragia fontium TaxID=82985 RepID=A0AAJ5BIK6_9GAMM|nr:peptidoglycan-binding protein LysM [Pragia fontium]AKJ40751.1 peptidoglycan-binding protein [Pragia fontium]SFD39847.1 BON domain-containing protein [Pragia fontium DSM 5563 = ATCC 49100]SUB80918.1 LysM domain/BON superfamily protein [Pragia fontium]VEJ52732.1 LysM domain/BON superfamily protein [Pragia fontium]GKX63682.1 peptidoglycan-binding protein LysM [Pragia fontium]